jgi:hypothetical protein
MQSWSLRNGLGLDHPFDLLLMMVVVVVVVVVLTEQAQQQRLESLAWRQAAQNTATHVP